MHPREILTDLMGVPVPLPDLHARLAHRRASATRVTTAAEAAGWPTVGKGKATVTSGGADPWSRSASTTSTRGTERTLKWLRDA